ncbi:MAG: hypothetical protein M1454_02520 [Candidatus Thermoplasmatota archaeon]|nr:hypothetical protein [Candidatus Thermoplasmatota archaeon]MCL5730763.1 hypothetical protein [Candidatus Thermoplasmatota archaeon]
MILYAVVLILIMIGGCLAAIGWLERRRFPRMGIPSGKMLYADLESREQILVSRRYGITGRPDMVVRRGRSVIPYVYRRTDSDTPRKNHVVEMGAYFIILEEEFPGFVVPYGILRYGGRSFRVENNGRLKARALYIVNRIRNDYGEPERNHSDKERCMRCPFSSACYQTLIKNEHSQPQWIP